ncbi:MAG TPA: histidinol phosphate phosphatase, partial [Gemmatimonadaceae bacterium]|nr:histidinol phosphate phosphatase [Gemmatimonadaceae bacterium]
MSESYLDAVTELARIAGDFAMSQYGRTLTVDVKHDGSPVTLADRGAEERARAWIEKRFPEDGIL